MAPYHRDWKMPGSMPTLNRLAPSAVATHPTAPTPLPLLRLKTPQYSRERHSDCNSSGFCFNSCRKEDAGEAWFP